MGQGERTGVFNFRHTSFGVLSLAIQVELSTRHKIYVCKDHGGHSGRS